jgi:hypothetical protein
MTGLGQVAVGTSWPIPVLSGACGRTVIGEPLASIRQSVNRQRPFEEPDWQTTIAGLFGLESTMRPRGRPALSEISR